jgi:glucan phosphorylase
MDRYVPLPALPPRITRLSELAFDLWWSWNAAARDVFRDLDLPLWRFTEHNPVLLLHLIEPERLQHAAQDPDFLRLYDRALAALDVVRAGAGTWWARRGSAGPPIACIAPAFSLHHSLPVDCDGRAIVAGDFAKEASDLGIPLVGVGLMYPRGYVHQRLSPDGWQQESYEQLDWSDAAVSPALGPDGTRCAFIVPMIDRDVHVQIWQIRAGRVAIYLIDTDVPENSAEDREISAALCPPGSDALVRQRALLAEGAPRTLAKMGIERYVAFDPHGEAPGVHGPSWIARDLAVLLERYLGTDWRDHQDESAWWERLSMVPDQELWGARQRLRAFLIDFLRERARRRWTRERAAGPRLVALGTLLDPGTLTIGVAGRINGDFRGDVVFHDTERLAAILTARRRPVQIVFAGRAHAGDDAGRRHLHQLFSRAIDPAFAGRIAFLEDYDLHAARLLVQGCDVWISAPADPSVASLGALKAGINGVPVIEIPPGVPGAAAARLLYRQLEEAIVPTFYARDRRGVPQEWVGRLRDTIRDAIPRGCARGAVKAAAERLYNRSIPHV